MKNHDVLKVSLYLILCLVELDDVMCAKPNILVILADDLDSELGGMNPLTKTKSWIADQGVSFNNSFTVSPICCPSRWAHCHTVFKFWYQIFVPNLGQNEPLKLGAKNTKPLCISLYKNIIWSQTKML